VGQAYIGTSTDKDGHWLAGENTYRLHVPADVPAKLFWSVTAYDTDTRCFIHSPEDMADRSSLMDVRKNAAGSGDIYVDPNAPAGFEHNWIPTIPGNGWFAYFRLYGPAEPYLNQSWVLPDFERVK
jgi:hypothetical protein